MRRLLGLLATLAAWPALAQPICNPLVDPHYIGCLPTGTINRATTLAAAQGSTARQATVAQLLGQIATSDLAGIGKLTLPPAVYAGSAGGGFYADHNVTMGRFGDRLFVGAAADQQGYYNRALTPRDWLSDVMAGTSIGPWAAWGAQGASMARHGTIGWLTASRTSDARASAALLGYTPSSIGTASWAINDDTASGTTTTGYAYYGEAWRMSGASYQPVFGLELEGVNFGGLATGSSNPYHVNTGGGTYTVQLGCGGGQTSGTSDCDAALTTVANPNRFRRGIVFGAASITGTDGTSGDAGFGEAMSFGRNQGIVWRTPEVSGGEAGANAGGLIRSTVATASSGGRMEFQDGAIVFTNGSGQAGFAVEQVSSAASYLAVQAGSGSGAAGIYARGSAANIGLYPGSGGEIQMTSPVCGAGGSLPGTSGAGYLKINVNGTDLRIPLLTSSQTGC